MPTFISSVGLHSFVSPSFVEAWCRKTFLALKRSCRPSLQSLVRKLYLHASVRVCCRAPIQCSHTLFCVGKWYMLIITSLVVLASAAQFQKSQCANVDSGTCTSNKYAISLGAIGFVFGLVISILAYMGSLNIFVETGTAFLLFVMYTAGVGVITFDFGSGVTIGNLVSVLPCCQYCRLVGSVSDATISTGFACTVLCYLGWIHCCNLSSGRVLPRCHGSECTWIHSTKQPYHSYAEQRIRE